jgi:hypothetical protein
MPAMSGETLVRLLDTWLSRRLKGEALSWLVDACARIDSCEPAAAERTLFLAFAATRRRVGATDLSVDAEELSAGQALIPGWDPRHWSVDQTARVRLVLALRSADADAFLTSLDKLFAASGLEELVALYQALALLPHSGRLRDRAAEGIRNNMRSVFAAVALANPYPSAWLEEGAWNQMVLKCLFVDCPLGQIIGLDRRSNPALTRMLCDYAHERWAAKRVINPQLWRPVGACLDGGALQDLERLLQQGQSAERQAAALALGSSLLPEAGHLLARHPSLASAFASGQLSWAALV